jgi:hypothetical protein
MPKIVKKYGKITLVLGLILVLVVMYVTILPTQASGTLPNRSVTISNSTPGATGVDYAFKADFTASTIKCIEVVFSATAVTNGMVTTSATQGAAADWGGTPFTKATWADIEKATNGTVRFWDATGEAGASAAKFGIGTITNPSALAYSAKINTYAPGSCTDAATCCTGTKTDEGTVVFAIVSGVAVSATVGEYLTFTIGDADIGFGSWTAGSTVVRWATADPAVGSETQPDPGAPSVLTIKSNATHGTSVTIRSTGNGASAGLYDSVSTNVIDAVAANGATTPISGTEGYAVYAKSASGITIDEGFNDDVTGPLAITTSAQRFVYGAAGVNATVDLAAKAAIAVTTQAGTYTDTLVLVATPTY